MGTFGKITIQTLHCHKGLLAKTFNDIILIQLVVIQKFHVLTHCKHKLKVVVKFLHHFGLWYLSVFLLNIENYD